MEISKTFRFEAAHSLPNVPPGHKCGNLHGHSFTCEIFCTGAVEPHEGWVLDFADISSAFAPFLLQLDHNHLNTIDGLENPTSENIARWIYRNLRPRLSKLSAVAVSETCTSMCRYTGE
jgi:6-pyruvoyltetrahydropterin/6-carboxytetrahydropterin synthase